MNQITLTSDTHETLLEHAREGAPEEVCGVLGGRREYHSYIESVHRTPNVATRPRIEYVIEPETQLDMMEDIESTGRDVVGFYHSHPSGPTGPSETDAKRATWSDHYYLIVALDGEPSIGAWRWNGEAFEREQLTIE